MSATTSTSVREQRFRISGVSWEKYEQMGAWFAGRHVRLTYDRGELEIMTLSREHEHDKHVLGALIMVLAEELDIDLDGGGSMTFKREDLERGLEPAECYWIQNEATIRGRRDFNTAKDPPPDLVVEVEISRSTLDRLAIHATMKIPEIWRWDGQALRICLWRKGRYIEHPTSRAFPFLAPIELVRFLKLDLVQGQAMPGNRWCDGRDGRAERNNEGQLDLRSARLGQPWHHLLPDFEPCLKLQATMSEIKLLRAFRAWVREQQEQNWPTAPPRSPRPKQPPKRTG